MNLVFSKISVAMFSKLLLKYVVFTNLTLIVLNRGVNNYYVMTFLVEEISPIQSPERGVLNFSTMGEQKTVIQ
jgi:hypothetical protein